MPIQWIELSFLYLCIGAYTVCHFFSYICMIPPQKNPSISHCETTLPLLSKSEVLEYLGGQGFTNTQARMHVSLTVKRKWSSQKWVDYPVAQDVLHTWNVQTTLSPVRSLLSREILDFLWSQKKLKMSGQNSSMLSWDSKTALAVWMHNLIRYQNHSDTRQNSLSEHTLGDTCWIRWATGLIQHGFSYVLMCNISSSNWTVWSSFFAS